MKFFHAFIAFAFLVSTVTLNAQENPKIDVNSIISSLEDVDPDYIFERLEKGEFYYKREFYRGSFRAFYDIYEVTKDVSALNYKLGISALMGGQPRDAADFLLESLPSVADDYYLQLGYAYQARLDYSRARDAFKHYNQSLSSCKKRKFRPQYNQLMSECEFGERNASDSIPSFVKNLGPAINSYYNEYGAVENSKHDRIFYTTRRPDHLPDIPGHRNQFKERIMEASYKEGEVSEGTEVTRLNSRFNSGVAGMTHNEDFLFVYRGKKRGGQVRVADILGKKVSKPSKISNRIDRKMCKETAFAETSTGRVFFVSDHRDGKGGKDIWTSRREGHGRYTRPQNIGSIVNTSFDEEAVYVTPDGNTLYFASNGHPGFGGFDLYKTTKNAEGEWMTPQNLGQPYNSPQDDLFYFPASDSLVTLVSSSRPGGHGGLDIFKIRKDIRIPFTISGSVSDKDSGDSLHAKLSLVDTLRRQEVVSASTDSLTGAYFIALEDTGNYVLQASAEGYKMDSKNIESPTRRNTGLVHNFELEKLLHPYTIKGTVADAKTEEPLQAEIIFKPLGKDSVTHRVFSNRISGKYSITFEDKFNLKMIVSAKDYYEFSDELMLERTIGSSEEKNIDLEKSVTAFTLSGKVVEEGTNDPVPAELALFRADENNAFKINYADSVSGKYSLTVYEKGPFLLEVNADGYFFNNMSLEFHPDSTLKVHNIMMKPMTTGASIVAENILFTSGKATLRSESYPELDRLVRLLEQNPSVRIEVSGHTDNVGSASLNKRLSKARALTVKRYLEGEGIHPNRIEYEGYGFDNPIAPNTTPEGRAQNRRVEIEVIE